MTALTQDAAALDPISSNPSGRQVRSGKRYGTHVFLIAMSVLWLIPLLWTAYTSLRSNADTNKHGYWSLPSAVTLHNYTSAWTQGNFGQAFVNSGIITVPAVLLTLFLASMMAFAVSRFAWKFNLTLLILFTAGNLIPPQVLATPLFEMFRHTNLPSALSGSGNLLDTYYSVIIVDVAFQLGFCTFVMSNYMKALSADLTEAALVDGCGVWRMYYSIILPLCRPAIAALATLEVIFIYNDFFWALIFIQSGNKFPATNNINNLKGQHFDNYNLIAAGAILTVIPTLAVYAALQRQFVAGLTLGGSKG